MGQSEKKKPSTAKRVAGTLLIWFAISFVAATIVAVVPNVKPCFQKGLSGCWAAVRGGFAITPPEKAAEWSSPGAMDWVILVVGLIVAVRIMFPAEDPLADDAESPRSQTS